MLRETGLGKALLMAFLMAVGISLSGCERPADVASRNLSNAADNFEIVRDIKFINGITGDVLLNIVGRCSLGNFDSAGELSVTCADVGGYKKHFLGLSDNVTFIAQQIDVAQVSTFHTRVFFRPQSLIPDIDFQGDMDELTTDTN